MSIWTILNIQKTKNKELIKSAYREKLSITNPEDNQDAFIALRKAYEEALRLSDIDDAHALDKADDDYSLKKYLDDLYRDYYKRISPDEWEKLFLMDCFIDLDTSIHSEEVMLEFVMEHYLLPQKVWKVIVNQIGAIEKQGELKEKYPSDFIDYMLNNAKYEDNIDFELISGDEENFDEFIRVYKRLAQAIRQGSYGEEEELFSELVSMNVSHPYISIARYRIFVSKSQMSENVDINTYLSEHNREFEECICGLKEANEDYPEDARVLLDLGDSSMLTKNYNEARQYYNAAKSIKSDDYVLNGRLAELEYYSGNYKGARDLFMDLLKENNYDAGIRAWMIKSAKNYICQLNEQLKQFDELESGEVIRDNEENEIRRESICMELAWSHFQCYEIKEAIDILDSFEADSTNIHEYNNLKGRCYLCMEKYEEAKGCFIIWKQEIEKLPKDSKDQDIKKKTKRYPYVNFLIGNCFLKLYDYDNARKYILTALEYKHEEEIIAYEAMCCLEYDSGKYEECIRRCEILNKRMDYNYISYMYKAKAYYMLGFVKEALQAAEYAIRIYPYMSDPYILQIEIFSIYKRTDQAKEILDSYNNIFGSSDDLTDCNRNISLMKALIAKGEGRYEEAALICESVLVGVEDDISNENICKTCEVMGSCYEELKNYDKAIEAYLKLIEIDPYDRNANGRIAYFYKLKRDFLKSIEYYKRQIDIAPEAYYYINMGLLQDYMDDNNEAFISYSKAIEMEPENSYAHDKRAIICEILKDYDSAIKSADLAIKYADNDSSKKKGYLSKARVLQKTMKLEESEGLYVQYIQEFGYDAEISYDYSELLYRMNRINEAVDIVQRMLRLCDIEDVNEKRSMQMLYRQLIFIYGCEGEIEKANIVQKLLVEIDGKECRNYACLADMYKINGYDREALELFKKARELDKSNYFGYQSYVLEIHANNKWKMDRPIAEFVQQELDENPEMNSPFDCIVISRLYRVLGKLDKAKEAMARAVKFPPHDGCYYDVCPDMIIEIGEIYEAEQNYSEALKVYQKCLDMCGHNAELENKIKRIK